MAFMHLYVSNVRCSCIQTQLSESNQTSGIHKRDNMPSTDATQQMVEEEIAPINSQLGQFDYELDSRIDSLHTQVDGRIDVVADHVTQLDGSLEDRFVKNDELDQNYWRNNKVDKHFEAHADRAEATAGDVELLGDHVAKVWEYTGNK